MKGPVMALPIVGPITKVRTQIGGTTSLGYTPVVYSQTRETYKQAKPYDLVLPYRVETTRVLHHSSTEPGDYTDISWSVPKNESVTSEAANRAYQKLVGQIGARSQLASTLGEHKQAFSMVATRASQLLRVVKQVKRGKFVEAAEELKVSLTGKQVKTLKGGAKSIGNFWLETWFGWLPTIADISDSIDVIQGPLPNHKIRAGSRVSKVLGTRSSKVYFNPAPGFSESHSSEYQTSWVHTGCKVRVTNPNLYLANAMGFTNPVAVAWELTPFSFVVDWFANVGDIINSYTDFIGLEVTEGWTTKKEHLTAVSRTNSLYVTYSYGLPVHKVVTRSSSKRKEIVQRSEGIAVPSLQFVVPGKVSITRAATAISLLLQGLK